MVVNFDPFGMVKVSEQTDMISSLADSSRNINRIRKEIVQLSERVDEMIGQNANYMVELNNTKGLTVDRYDEVDEDISEVSWDVNDYFAQVAVLDNQIVSIRDVSSQFNMAIVQQKTDMVIRRVNEMLSKYVPRLDLEYGDSSPDLVIVPKSVVSIDEKVDDIMDDGVDNEFSLGTETDNDEDMYDSVLTSSFEIGDVKGVTIPTVSVSNDVDEQKSGIILTNEYDDDIFETVIPFEATPMFSDRTDDSLEGQPLDDVSLSAEELKNIHDKKDGDLELYYSDDVDEMPDAFWITQEADEIQKAKDFQPSFDDQIYALLNENENGTSQDVNNNVKRKKLEVKIDTQKKVA